MPSATQNRSDEGNFDLNNHPNVIDMSVFEQILEMDDDEDEREFSRTLVFDFFDQAHGTLAQMREKLDERDLNELSRLGHFLKGSSATLGLIKLQKSCEKIQNYGAQKDATGNLNEPDAEKCLQNIRVSLRHAEDEFAEAKALMERFFRVTDD